MSVLPQYVEGLPNICGSEPTVEEAARSSRGESFCFLAESRVDFGRIKIAAAIRLHVRQPSIPAGGEDLHTTAITSNLKYMTDDPTIADNQIFSAAVGAASVLVKQFM